MSSITPIFSFNKTLYTNESMAGDLVSEIVDISEVTGYAVHFIWSGNPTGSLLVEASNTQNSSDFILVSTTALAGTADKKILNVEKAHYRFIKISYVRTSGTGNLSLHVSGKRV